VNIGSQASQQDVLATLAGTDTYWVQADRLDWITIPGSAVTLHSPSGATRNGRVIKRLGNLEEKGRMARILIAVNDPLCLTAENQERTPLLLGQYVRVDVQGRELEQVYSIPRSALRENHRIWIAAPNGTLDIREVDVRWRAEKNILISGNLRDGERLITTDITTPMQNRADCLDDTKFGGGQHPDGHSAGWWCDFREKHQAGVPARRRARHGECECALPRCQPR